MKNYILAIDQGTTSSRAIIFDKKGAYIASSGQEFTQHFPKPGWVEHDQGDIWGGVVKSCQQAIEKADISAEMIAGIGVTNQRETVFLWDKETGEPVYKAVVWQDRRTSDVCKDLKSQGHELEVQKRSGLLLDPYFSASKIAWVLDNVEGARERAEKGVLLFGTSETFLLWHFTKGKSHFTDISNASRTCLFNIHTQDWDDELLSLFKVPRCILPEIKENIDDFGVVDREILGAEIPIVAMAGDQQAASFGQGCFEPGMIKSTYGTGAFVLKNVGTTVKESAHKLLSTVAWKIKGVTHYALEGSVFVAGSAIQFLRDGLEILEDASQSEAIAETLASNDGVYFVPALTGLGAPYWNADARGVICGLTRGTTSAHLVRAALEAQAYQTKDLLDAMEKDTGIKIKALRVDGGLVKNNWACQFMADILDVTVDRPVITETTALGVAMMVAIGVGFFDNEEDVTKLWQLDRRFDVSMTFEERNTLYNGWKKAVERCALA